MKELLTLFLVFAKVGGFTFGGGYAMLPVMQREIVDRQHWATGEELVDYYAIGQCTPGVIAVNVATFIGQKRRGFIGGLFATLGVITPSVIIITLIAAFVSGFSDNEIVMHAFKGMRAAVAALVVGVLFKLGKKSIVDVATVVIFVAVTLLSMFTPLSPAIYVVLAGVCGIVIKHFGKGGRAAEKAKTDSPEEDDGEGEGG